PQTGGEAIQDKKPLPMHRAQSHSKRGEIPDAIDKAEGENKAGIVSFEPVQGGFDTVAPFREAIEQAQSEIPTDPEIGLIAGKAAEPRRREQQHGIEQTLGRGKSGKQNESFTFEEGPHEGNQIKAGTVLSDQPADVHSRPVPDLSCRP